MKRLLVIIFIFMGLVGSASEPTYVIFTSNNSDTTEPHVTHSDYTSRWDQEVFKYPMHVFHVDCRRLSEYSMFGYIVYVEEQYDAKIERRSLADLDNLNVIDLDKELPTLNKQSMRALINQMYQAEELYFIDRNYIQNDSVAIYPVRRAGF